MLRIILLAVLFLTGKGLLAQVVDTSVPLPDSIVQAEPEWVDTDNDGLLDILLLTKNKSGSHHIRIIKGDTLNTLGLDDNATPIIAYNAYTVADYNRDNAMDVLISGEKNGVPVTALYINRAGFGFEEVVITLPVFTSAVFSDLDNDATPELIASGKDQSGHFFTILKQEGEYTWRAVNDSFKIRCVSMEMLDADGDGDWDLYVSGEIEPDSLISGFLINKGNFHFKLEGNMSVAGNTSRGDFNGDGSFEVVLMAKRRDGLWRTQEIYRTKDKSIVRELPIEVESGNPFVADFNSDGTADIQYYGTNTTGDTINNIRYSSSQVNALRQSNVVRQRFGDRDHDGDLDFLHVLKEDSLRVIVTDNTLSAKNAGPGSPKNAVALRIFDRMFMYWEKPDDDRTPSPSLTYDLFLNGEETYQAAEFDLINEKRLTVTHGNNGTANFKLLKNVDGSQISFAIQAVDNAFHAGRPCVGQTAPCNVTIAEALSVCTHEKVVLTSPANVLWFSFANGYLGSANELTFSTAKSDTVFSFNPLATGCAALKVWSINMNDDTVKIEEAARYVCQNANVQFQVEPGWTDIQWTSTLRGDLGTSNQIQYDVTVADLVTATLTNAKGCTVIRKTEIHISKPALIISGEQYKIMKGGDVQLQAEGAQRYEWAPASGLDKVDVPNPVASPSKSIVYSVTGYDSLGCKDQATVTVTVEETGFIPNLFSPNDDGKNDQLKIYGLASAQDFSFSVYNREGNLVYRTSDVSEAVQRGWDGTQNGAKQPAGVYFWKVKGAGSTGEILLNGKDSGSIVLIR